MSAIIDGTSASSLSGTLTVTGATTLSSTLGVTGIATFGTAGAVATSVAGPATNGQQLVLGTNKVPYGLAINPAAMIVQDSVGVEQGAALVIMRATNAAPLTGCSIRTQTANGSVETPTALTVPGTLLQELRADAMATNGMVTCALTEMHLGTGTLDAGTSAPGSWNVRLGADGTLCTNTAFWVDTPPASGSTHYLYTKPGLSGTNVILQTKGPSGNVGLSVSSYGTGAVDIYTNDVGQRQVSVLHTASADRYITLTGSNGGNPTIATSAGSLAITPAVAMASTLAVTGVTTVQAGTVAAPAITTSGDTNTGIFFPAADTIAFGEGGAEVMRINSSGNVLIGATTQAAAARSTVQTAADNSRFIGFQSAAGAEIGNIFNNTTATQYNTSSDYRLKDNVAPMIGALAKVAALKPVTYKWKSDGSDGQGFIAHELQEVVPDCVTGEKDATWEEEYEVTPAVPAVVDADGVEVTPAVEAVKATRTVPSYQGVDTSFLVATLVASIQELKAIIDAQATRIAALENV